LIDFTKSIENNADLEQECLVFQTDCFCCGAPGENKMCMCTIPYFKELIITCFTCEKCGFKTAEVKGGGGFSEKATKMVFRKEKTEDLCRDIFKSETAKISIPELNFETDTGSMGGMFTTVEGVLSKILDNLENVPFSFGDSKENSSMEDFLKEFRSYLTQDKKFTLIIDDPLSNSFIFSPLFPNKDPQLDVIEYERTWEQNEELGINDMKVENYVVSHENNLNTVENNVEESKTEELPIENKEESSNTVGRSKGG